MSRQSQNKTFLSRNDVLRLSFFVFAGTVILSFFTQSASLLYDGAISDYNCFVFIARAWRDGALPYAEFVDNKGPLLYLIDRMGLWLAPGKMGIWVLELVFFVLTFELLWRVGRSLGATWRINALAASVSLVLYAYYLVEGNTTEEWSMPFVALVVLLMVGLSGGDRTLSEQSGRMLWSTFVAGLCLGFVTMIRGNNGVLIAGAALGLAVLLGYERNFGLFMKCAGVFVVGLLLAVAPFVVYFASKDALEDMYFVMIYMNLRYMVSFDAGLGGFGSYVANAAQMGACFTLPLVAWFVDRRKATRYFVPSLMMSLVMFIVFITSNGWMHYFLLAIPLAWMAIALTQRLSRVWRVAAVVLVLLPTIAMHPAALGWYAYNTWKNIMVWSPGDTDRKNAATIVEHIPKEERDSIYMACGVGDVGCFNLLGTRPVGRYFGMQDRALPIDSLVCEDIARSFLEARPLWIFSYLPLERYPGLPAVDIDSIKVWHKNTPSAGLETEILCYELIYVEPADYAGYSTHLYRRR